ncbi:MAG: UDP-N-acetylglucosamine 2-epimerase (non-hydrolyzing), partial [Bdellovibrionaceae bacterium]|nr:UDP-N-acetylglucosamine 2-epimerase (non-hydrolyzing) [Pseudobdellovibrionaceae bacterium]
APTEGAKLNLLNEGVREESIYVVGNTVVDAQKIVLEKLLKNSNLISDRVFQLVESIKKENKKIIFMTCHRRENLGQPIYQILQGVKLAMEKLTNYTLIYAVHPNPKVHKPVAEVLSGLGNVVLLDSQSYFSTLHLLKSADFVLTDSGGIQEEVIALSKPVVVLRDETERPEVIESGLGQLVSASKELVYEACIRVAQRTQISTSSKNPYGEGRSARLIVNLFET